VQDFRNLKVWKTAHALTLDVYAVTADFPRAEMFGLTSQIRRASASIGANIAEGCGRRGDPELLRFLQIAMGSASELEYHLLLAHDLKMMPMGDYEKSTQGVIEVKKMVGSLIHRLRAEQVTN
jgi:four helix bundle protein